MVPAPMLAFEPIFASPRYVRCIAFVPSPMVLFFSSTKFAMRLDDNVVSQNGVAEHAARTNSAACAELGFSEQLHTRLEQRVFSRDYVWIDEPGFRQLEADAGVHQRGA